MGWKNTTRSDRTADISAALAISVAGDALVRVFEGVNNLALPQ